MPDATIVRYVSGDWSPALGHVRLRVESDKLGQPQDLLFSPADIQPLIILLLVLSGKAGPATLAETEIDVRDVVPLRPDALGLGETDDGDIVLQLDIGQTTLAFSLPSNVSRQLGQSLIALGAESTKETAN
jgi:hypothetical protein